MRAQLNWSRNTCSPVTAICFSEGKIPAPGQLDQALKDSGFVEQLHGEHKPPASHYTLGTEDQGFYAEFLTPLHGPASNKHGVPNATATIAGVSAQKLRYLDVLQADPWTVTIGNDGVFPLDTATDVLVAHPLRFHGAEVPD